MLVLLGRCMLQWAFELYQFSSTSNWVAQAQQLLATLRTLFAFTIPLPGVNDLLLGPASAETACFSSFASQPPAMQQLLASLQALLTPGSQLACELAAAGFGPEGVLSSIEAALDALALREAATSSVLGSTAASGNGSSSGGVGNVGGDDNTDGPVGSQQAIERLTASLQQLGQVLTGFLVPFCCNNPDCRIATGPTEQSLVGRRSSICSACLTARYCGRDCQRVHWKRHKPVCKALAAHSAAAAAAAAASPE
jgi:hypothetical protein